MSNDPSLAVTERTRRRPSSHHKSPPRDFAEAVAWVIDDSQKDSVFFARNPPRALPHFQTSEVKIGSFLGDGEFGVVKEITKFNIKDTCTCTKCADPEKAKPSPSSQPPTQIVFEGPFPTAPNPEGHRRLDSVGSRVSFALDAITIGDDDEWFVGEDVDVNPDETGKADRGYMAEHYMRDGKARYALKQLKDDIPRKMMLDAAIDLASEAKFLACLSHPNILKLRGTVSHPGKPDFSLILDRLQSTLVENMEKWKQSEKRFRGFLGRVGRRSEELQQLRSERLVALFDIARAMRYLHENKIVYRDAKPDNIGFDVRGDAKIFDFGLAKELLPGDLVTPPDSYQATGITGSRRYMAPEVMTCKDYGLSADVFGYGVLFWEVMALKTPFQNLDVDKHFTEVVVKGTRPKALPWLGKPLHSMMEECWSAKPDDRPSFARICEALRAHLNAIEAGMGRGPLTNRSAHLLDISWTSRYGSYRSPNAARDRSSSNSSTS